MDRSNFKAHLEKEFPECGECPLYVAVSGGVDSMVLLDLLTGAGYIPTVLHANFELRGKESEQDEQFVRSEAEKRGVPVITKRLPIEPDSNIQLAARKARYEWFEEVCSASQGLLLTAHHEDDVIETFLINLLRGSGLKGLAGIPSRREFIRRPLLGNTQEEILTYAQEHNVPFREDSSNASNKYLRNLLRHQVLPQLFAQAPQFRPNVGRSIDYLGEDRALLEAMREEYLARFTEQAQDGLKIDLSTVETPLDRAVVESKLRALGMRGEEVAKVWSEEPGSRRFKAGDLTILVERGMVSVFKIGVQEYDDWECGFSLDDALIDLPVGSLELEMIEKPLKIINKENEVHLDMSGLTGDLVVRFWREGDRFQPLGMRGSKKLSDFWSDRKVSDLDKRRIPLLWAGEALVWVVGHEIGDAFKITPHTTKVLRIIFKPKDEKELQ